MMPENTRLSQTWFNLDWIMGDQCEQTMYECEQISRGSLYYIYGI